MSPGLSKNALTVGALQSDFDIFGSFSDNTSTTTSAAYSVAYFSSRS